MVTPATEGFCIRTVSEKVIWEKAGNEFFFHFLVKCLLATAWFVGSKTRKCAEMCLCVFLWVQHLSQHVSIAIQLFRSLAFRVTTLICAIEKLSLLLGRNLLWSSRCEIFCAWAGLKNSHVCQCGHELSKGTSTNGLRIDTTQGKKCHALLQYIYEAICTIANERNLLEHILLGGNYDISLTCLCTWYDEF